MKNLILALVLCVVAQLTTTQSTKHTVTIRWTAPAANGATIVAIQVFRSMSANLSNASIVCNVAPTVTTCTDQTTRPNSTYWYYCVSVGTQANSAKSNVSKITVVP